MRLKLKYDFECMELADHFVAVPTGEDADSFRGVIKLNDSAASIVKLLKVDRDEEEIVEALAQEYDAPHEILEASVRRCIAELKRKGLLV